MKLKDDERICDFCQHFYQHPSGVSERCAMVEKRPFSRFTPDYADARIDGQSATCKEFSRIPTQKRGGRG